MEERATSVLEGVVGVEVPDGSAHLPEPEILVRCGDDEVVAPARLGQHSAQKARPRSEVISQKRVVHAEAFRDVTHRQGGARAALAEHFEERLQEALPPLADR